jgi:hypothetical protein
MNSPVRHRLTPIILATLEVEIRRPWLEASISKYFKRGLAEWLKW